MNQPLLKNYRGRFPFKLATTSYIYPDSILPNITRLGPFLDEIELVLFESGEQENIPDDLEIDGLLTLSDLHGVGFNVHLPIDISLSDESEGTRSKGISAVKKVIHKTRCLNPSTYTLHLDLRDRSGREETDVQKWRSLIIRSLDEIVRDGIDPNCISIETLRYPFEWIEDIVKEFGFSICLDIGHILVYGQDLRNYFEKYLIETSIIHLHGFDNGVDHLGIHMLEEKKMEFILSSLRNFQGIVSIEVFSLDDLSRSLKVLEEKWG